MCVVRERSPPGLLPFYQGGKDLSLKFPADIALYTIGPMASGEVKKWLF